MIGARLSPHRAHSTAIVIRVIAAVVILASVFVISHAFIAAAFHYIGAPLAFAPLSHAAALMLVALITVRHLDPLR